MPRRSRPKPGADTGRAPTAQGANIRSVQPAAAPTNMAYGARKETLEAQRAVPLPQVQTPSPLGAGGAMPGQPGPEVDPFSAALAQASAMSSPSQLMGAPSARPDEPVQAGLPVGPGAGPSDNPEPRAAALLDQLAADTGDPAMSELANMAHRIGM